MSQLQANGQRVRQFRLARGWTQEELARLAGYTVKTVWKAEASGELRPQTLVDLAETLGVEPADIVSQTEAKRYLALQDAQRGVLMEAYQALEARDIKAALSTVHHEAVYVFPGPEGLPWRGTHRGKEEIRVFYQTSFDLCPPRRSDFVRVVAESDCIDLHVMDHLWHSRLGREIHAAVCIHSRFCDGKLAYVQCYNDWTSFQEQCGDEGLPF